MSLSSTCNGITISNDCNIFEQRNIFKQYNAAKALSAVAVVLEQVQNAEVWKLKDGNGCTEMAIRKRNMEVKRKAVCHCLVPY